MPKVIKEVKTEANSNTVAPSSSSALPADPISQSGTTNSSTANRDKKLVVNSSSTPAPTTDPPPSIDSHKKLRLIKSIQEFKELASNTNTESIQTIQPKAVERKSINIPICDIRIDEENTDNTATTNFNFPVSYVKYVKNISDESDLMVDYHADAEDENWLKLVSTKLSLPDLTITRFEHLVNILEKTNGNSRDTIIQSVALKSLLEKSGYDQPFVYKILPDLYRYWVSKRDKQGKPLVRKYWPPVLGTDTNPHQVFRVRDKERYRLRRHRRNDLDSFRKMQQLRKEFVQAKTILQLILERELLNQGSFRIEREIFKKKIRELEESIEDTAYKTYSNNTSASTNNGVPVLSSSSNPSSSDLMNTNPNDVPFHEPLFKQLWFQAMNKSSSYDNLYYEASKTFDADDAGSVSENGTILSNKKSIGSEKQIQRNGKFSSLDDSFDKKTDRKSIGSNSGGGQVGRKRKQKDKMMLYTLNKNGEVEIVNIESNGAGGGISRKHSAYSTSTHHDADVVIPYAGYSAPSILEVTQAYTTSLEGGDAANNATTTTSTDVPSATTTTIAIPRELRTIHEQVEGPKYICNPQWPNFTQTLTTMRDQAIHQSCALDYLRDLELKNDESGDRHAPVKYRSRYRIGRGGRLIIDRIPIYHDGPEAEEAAVGNAVIGHDWRNSTFQYPFLLQSNHMTQPTAVSNVVTNPPTAVSAGGNKSSTKSNTVPLTITAIAQLNNENQVKAANAAPVSGNTATGPSNAATTGDQLQQTSSHLIAKPLPEIPLSNRRLLTTYKKNNNPKNLISNYQWSNTLPNLFSTIPPMIPPPKPLLSHEKRKRLNEILAQSDSEDEKVMIPKSNSGIDVERNMTNKAVATEQAMTKFVFHV